MLMRSRTLVVGTTPDYIDWIRRVLPGECLFLTDLAFAVGCLSIEEEANDEIFADLADSASCRTLLHSHLERWGYGVGAVACFDCESLALAAQLAEALECDYPSQQAVELCRDKFLSKEGWQQSGLDCPAVARIGSAAALIEFFNHHGECIVKPVSGTGSELLARCSTPADCEQAITQMTQGFAERLGNRMYRELAGVADFAVAEAYVQGPEYSCDFIYEAGQATLLRLTRKVPYRFGPVGTTLAYVPAQYFAEEAPSIVQVETTMAKAAAALGVERAICMADFILSGERLMLIEMAPRPGGDCLPPMFLASTGIDMLAATIDFARGRPITIPAYPTLHDYVGLRLFARECGLVHACDVQSIKGDSRVHQVKLYHGTGHAVALPPEDYCSWLLGHVIFRPEAGEPLAAQCEALAEKFQVRWEEQCQPVH